MPCALCHRAVPLVQSHIIPAFVFRWMKDTGGTGHMRGLEKPNKRAQDGLKAPLLCSECEGRLNAFETPFATEVFHPLASGKADRVSYGPWMLPFCASVSWRVLEHFMQSSGDEMPDEFKPAAHGALAAWADVMMGRATHPGGYEQHFMKLRPITEHIEPNMPNNMNRYLLRAVDMYVLNGPGTLITYAKMGPFAIFGYATMIWDKWHGTRVAVRHGVVPPERYKVPKTMLRFFMWRASALAEMMRSLSERQRAKSDEALTANIERFNASGQFDAMLYDDYLFGEGAIVRKD